MNAVSSTSDTETTEIRVTWTFLELEGSTRSYPDPEYTFQQSML